MPGTTLPIGDRGAVRNAGHSVSCFFRKFRGYWPCYRKAVERMNGKVGVESEPEKGSRFPQRAVKT